MSLNFNLSEIEGYETKCWEWHKPESLSDREKAEMYFDEERGEYRQMSDLTYSLVWVSMAVGLGQITAASVDEWCRRLALFELLNGSFRATAYFTRDEVESHIGLTTNVSKETWASWRKRMTEGHDLMEATARLTLQQAGRARLRKENAELKAELETLKQ